MGRHTKKRSRLAKFAFVATLILLTILTAGTTHIFTNVRTPIPEGYDAVVYDDALNIIDVDEGSEIYIWPWSTVEFFKEPDPEALSGPYYLNGLFYDADDRLHEPYSNLFITMTEAQAKQYLNGRSYTAKTVDIAYVKHGQSLTAYAQMLADVELSLAIDEPGSSLPKILWRQDGPTFTRVDKEAARIYMEHKDDLSYLFVFDCKRTPLRAINHAEAVKEYREYFHNKGLMIDVGINDVTVMLEQTELPCVSISIDELYPQEGPDDGSIKDATDNSDPEPPTFFDLFDANREEPLLAWFYHSSKLVKNPALATQ